MESRSSSAATTLRPWWDVRAAWIVFWRVRKMVYAPWWRGWRATFKAWWSVGHGRHLVS